MTSRLDALRAMVSKNPGNAPARFGLATEALKAGLHEEAVAQLEVYLGMADDEGNAYGRLAESLASLGRRADARAALQRGIEAATRFGHPGMAEEFEVRLRELA